MSLVEKDLVIFFLIMTVIIISLLITLAVLLSIFVRMRKKVKESFTIKLNEREHCEKTCSEKFGGDREECIYDCLQYLFKRGGQTAQFK